MYTAHFINNHVSFHYLRFCFWNIFRVLYFSVHRYEHGAFWPNLRESDFHYIGSGAGKGFNVNVPLNKTKMGNADYLAIWHQLLLPLAYEVIHLFYFCFLYSDYY